MRTVITILLATCLNWCFAQESKFTFVFLNTRTDKPELQKEELDELMKGHLANIRRLVKEGKMIMAGPFDGGGGIFIMNSNSVDSVKNWLKTDPGIKAERWRLEYFPYIPRVGSACTAKEDAEMVQYQFIRYTSTITKFNVQKAGETFKKHDDYLKQIIKTGNVVAEGIFPNRDGGILVMRGDVDRNLIEADPSMADAVFTIDFKKLWVMKGSFCE
ncbi:MAG TPA: YciI family protein [Cyclobacteriaceae bacterium]|nr:YciI family protein [Cyclobacteriaceae bacterium]